MQTTVGDIDIELWCRETPKACRNFIQLCMEGYYDDTIFHRVVKGFIVQGGDPTGTGLGGESVYDEPFRDEFHSRLRFERRGLVAMANAGKDDNLSQFFFTMGPAQELQNKHTIFGKVTGDTVFNMLKLQDAIVDRNERPEYPQRIIKTEILKNPFDDIVPREGSRKTSKDASSTDKVQSKSRATKDFKLLSFGDEAEEEEEEIDLVVQNGLKGKSKSCHDLIKNDSKLSSKSAASLYPDVEENGKERGKFRKRQADSVESSKEEEDDDADLHPDKIGKLEKQFTDLKTKHKKTDDKRKTEDTEDDSDDEYREERKKMAEAKNELKSLKRQFLADKKDKTQKDEERKEQEMAKKERKKDLNAFFGIESTSKSSKKFVRKSAEEREREASFIGCLIRIVINFLSILKALEMLKKFQNKLQKVAKTMPDVAQSTGKKEEIWLAHKLVSNVEEEGEKPVLAKDANLKDNDWYEIHDPRSKLSQLRREADARRSPESKKSKK